MRALILEDERRAAERLQRCIAALAPEIEILAVCESVREGLAFFEANTQNLEVVFSDIQLADGLSFDLFEQIPIPCPVIFTTAYDQYAIKAFKNKGIDYLLKPIDMDEMGAAIDKLKAMAPVTPQLADLMALAAQLNSGKPSYRERFMCKIGDKLKSISVDEVSAFYSENKGTYILTKEGRNYLIDYTLEQVEPMVDVARFYRINRKYLIALDCVEEMHVWSNSRLKLHLAGSKSDEIIVAREKTKEFKLRMGA